MGLEWDWMVLCASRLLTWGPIDVFSTETCVSDVEVGRFVQIRNAGFVASGMLHLKYWKQSRGAMLYELNILLHSASGGSSCSSLA